MLFDTHCHLQFNGYKKDLPDVLKRCKAKKMFVNVVGTQKDTSRWAVEMSTKYDWVYATIGSHPIHLFPTHVDEEESHFMSREEIFDEEYYDRLSQTGKVVGVGETGIDLFHLPIDVPKETVLAKQREIFLQQARFARKKNLALIIHSRNANDEILAALSILAREIRESHRVDTSGREIEISEIENKARGVMHCFAGGWSDAQKFLDLGLYLGFTGVITFPPKKTDPKAQEDLIEVVKNIPLDRILAETDAPYLAPQSYRGQRCEPWMVEEVVKKIAEIKGLKYEEVESLTERNARSLFQIA